MSHAEELIREYHAACDELEVAATAHMQAIQRRDEALGRIRAARKFTPGVVQIPPKAGK